MEIAMDSQFVRTGLLMDVNSYPQWLQGILQDCALARREVAEHEIFQLMRRGALPDSATRRFLVGFWPVIEQFPQYMAMNLLKVQYGAAPGHEMARKYLIRNIRVEQNHVEYWMDWAQGHGIGSEELLYGHRSSAVEALSHWCWHTCDRDPLPVGMAATNYAIEGVTGEWAELVYGSTAYEAAFPGDVRKKAMKWLRVHAHYDDTHPWEALEIIATLVGTSAAPRDIARIRSAILRSYEYMLTAFDDCLASDQPRRPAAPIFTAAAPKAQVASDRSTADSNAASMLED
jgi:pyrroloquinoline quinone (PQQ) biosynthesis protein C